MKIGKPLLPALAFLALASPAIAADTESDYRDRLCGGAGMQMEVQMPNGTRADCVSARLAIEVEFADKWHQALGQAMSYSNSTGHWPAIILVCRKKPRRCEKQFERLRDAAVGDKWSVPITVWRCDASAPSLDKCKREDLAQ